MVDGKDKSAKERKKRGGEQVTIYIECLFCFSAIRLCIFISDFHLKNEIIMIKMMMIKNNL